VFKQSYQIKIAKPKTKVNNSNPTLYLF